MAGSQRSEYHDYGDGGPTPASPLGRRPAPRYDDSYDARYDRDVPPPQQNPRYYDPPPRDYAQGATRDVGHDQNFEDRSNRGPQRDRPYAPSEPQPNEGNQVAPYDDEKAQAEWRRGYPDPGYQHEAYEGAYGREPLPTSEYDYDRRGPRSDDRYDDTRDGEQYNDRRHDDRSDRDYERRRRRGSASVDGNYSRHSASSQRRAGKDVFGGGEGQRGMGATLAGAGGGALLGHEFGDGALGTIGGAVAGALAAKVVETLVEKRRAEKDSKRREGPFNRRDGYDARDPSAGGSYGSNRRYDDDDDDYDDDRRHASRDPRDVYQDDYDRPSSRPRRDNRSRDDRRGS